MSLPHPTSTMFTYLLLPTPMLGCEAALFLYKLGVLWREVITNIQMAQALVTLASLGVAGVTVAQLSADVSLAVDGAFW